MSAWYVEFLFNTDFLLLIFFNLAALGDVDLCFLLMFVRKSFAVEEEMT